MSEHVAEIIVDSLARRWELVSKEGTDESFMDVPGATFDQSNAIVGHELNVVMPSGVGSMTFKRIA